MYVDIMMNEIQMKSLLACSLDATDEILHIDAAVADSGVRIRGERWRQTIFSSDALQARRGQRVGIGATGAKVHCQLVAI